MKLSKIILILFSFVFISNTNSLLAAGGEAYKNLKPGFSFEGPFGKFDRESLKRGYQVYSEVCASCHGMKQLSFRNLSQPGGPEFSIERVKEINTKIYFVDLTKGDLDTSLYNVADVIVAYTGFLQHAVFDYLMLQGTTLPPIIEGCNSMETCNSSGRPFIHGSGPPSNLQIYNVSLQQKQELQP